MLRTWLVTGISFVLFCARLHPAEKLSSAAPCLHFPQLTLYDGGGSSIDFPAAKNQLVFLGFQTKAKEELFLWYKALLREKHIAEGIQRTVLGILPSWLSWKATREPLIGLCRKMVPKEALPYFRIAFFDKAKLAALLGLSTERETFEHIHVFYVDGDSVIRWHAAGIPTRELLGQLNEIIQKQAEDVGFKQLHVLIPKQD